MTKLTYRVLGETHECVLPSPEEALKQVVAFIEGGQAIPVSVTYNGKQVACQGDLFLLWEKSVTCN